MKRFLTLLAFMVATISSYAYDCEVDGIYYYLFYGGASVTSGDNKYTGSVVIPEKITYNGTTYEVMSIGDYAFDGCSGLTSATIPNSVTSIGSLAFKGCSNLTSVTIPNSVTSIGSSAFEGCSRLTSITIPNSVTSIGDYAFNGCFKLTSATIPNSVTSIGGGAFSGCSGLTSVTIPNSVTSIGDHAFYYCTSLTSVTIPNSVTWIGQEAFSGCSGLTTLIVEEGNPSYCSDDNVLFNKDKTELIFCIPAKKGEFIIPNFVTSIGNYAFYYCTSLTSVTIPNSVTSIGGGAFGQCSGLTSITIPNSVTSIGDDAFEYCSGLTSVTIPNSVTSIGGYAFYKCSSLPIIDNIRYADTYLIGVVDKNCSSVKIKEGTRFIGSGAFSNCSSLTSIEIPNSVTSIGNYAFSDCSSLPIIDNIRYADTYLIGVVDKNCSSVKIKEGTRFIGSNAFYDCTSLTSVTIPNSVTSIGDHAFQNCSSLTSVTIPNSVTIIGNYAFCDCSGLTSVTIGNSVTSIGENAFYKCKGINTIYCYADEIPSTGGGAFGLWGYDENWNWINKIGECTLYVPSGSIDAYKSTDPWSQFGTILPIPEPENNLKIESVYADKNSEDVTLSVGLDNETQFTSVMFDLYLPEGVTALKDDLGYYMDLNNTRCNSRGGFTLEGEEQADGAVRVMLYSSRGTMISGDSGELLTITLKTTGDIAAGNHKFEVKRVICAVDVTAEGRYELKNADGYVRVKGVEEISLTVPEGGYATLCLPYAASLPTGLKAYKATGVNDGKVVAEEQQNIPACTPLIIKGTPGNYLFSGDNSAADKFEYSVGPLKSSLVPASSEQGYVLQNLSDGLGFYKIADALTVPAFRSVLDEAAASAAPAFVPVSFDEDANAIEATGYKLQTTDSSVYTIDGKRVETMEKGKIYIVNGVKMMVK